MRPSRSNCVWPSKHGKRPGHASTVVQSRLVKISREIQTLVGDICLVPEERVLIFYAVLTLQPKNTRHTITPAPSSPAKSRRNPRRRRTRHDGNGSNRPQHQQTPTLHSSSSNNTCRPLQNGCAPPSREQHRPALPPLHRHRAAPATSMPTSI